MASTKVFWLAILVTSTANAARWTITRVYIQTVTRSTYTNRTVAITTSHTHYTPVTLKPSITVTATPIKAYTTTSSSSYYDGHTYLIGDGSDDVVYVQRFYSPGAIPASDLTSSTRDYNQTDFTSTDFFQTMELMAPSSCPTPFTVTASSQVLVPEEVIDQVSIKSATTIRTTIEYDGTAYTYTLVSAFLASTSRPTGAAVTRNYIYMPYITDCRNPTSTPRPTSDGRGGPSNGDDSGNSINQVRHIPRSCAWSNCGNTPYWGIIILTVLPAVFLLGFLESYHWFICLMSGEGALRGGTISWILLFLPSIFLTRYIPARNEEDRERLRAQWQEKTFSQKFSLWRQWGLRYRYDMELLGVHAKYTYGNPAQGEKLVQDWYGESGDRPQIPATYMNQHAAGQMPMAPPQSQSPTPQLPPRARLAGRNSRSVSSDLVLPPVPEEAGPSSAKAKGKEVEMEAGGSDVQAGPALKIEGDMNGRSTESGTHQKDPKDKDNA
ncbi:hypothetical protein E5D57_005762 [Metarhizium anisopliae]|nr:hypothetical protein E5D57_005762 [Metarhizium anisopliae]